MLKSADYVDPILAQKIVTLQAELSKIQLSKTEILNNRSLQVQTKNKLLKYQVQCEQNIRQLLAEQRDKLADYLDQQTNVITKDNRKSVSHHHKNSFTLNQSTRIDISTDDSKSFEATRKSETFTKSINQIHFKHHQDHQHIGYHGFANKNRAKMRRMTEKVVKQQKLINMLVLWVKIYHEREQQQKDKNDQQLQEQNKRLSQENKLLSQKCDRLQSQIQSIRLQFKISSQRALQSHRRREQLKIQNKEYELKRKQLISTMRSLQKQKSKI